MARKSEIIAALESVRSNGRTAMRQQSGFWVDVSTIDSNDRYMKCALVHGDLLNISTWDRSTGREIKATCHWLKPSQRTWVRNWLDRNFWSEV